MRRKRRKLDSRRRAHDHLVAEVDQFADFLADQHSGLAAFPLPVAQTLDHGSAAVARNACYSGGTDHALKSILLQIRDALFKCRLVYLVAAKEHTIFIIMRECLIFFPWTKEPPAPARRSTTKKVAASRWNRARLIAFIRIRAGWSRMRTPSGARNLMPRDGL